MRIFIIISMLVAALMMVGCGTGITTNATVKFTAYPAHIADPNSCTSTFDCEYWGECSFKDGLCVADAEYQCKQSEVCRTLGQCNLKGATCTL